ncbi:Uncharacterised protein [Chlamydia trachomatis]|nr:Uncharacterised protein [Chlamydia trachomatis]
MAIVCFFVLGGSKCLHVIILTGRALWARTYLKLFILRGRAPGPLSAVLYIPLPLVVLWCLLILSYLINHIGYKGLRDTTMVFAGLINCLLQLWIPLEVPILLLVLLPRPPLPRPPRNISLLILRNILGMWRNMICNLYFSYVKFV